MFSLYARKHAEAIKKRREAKREIFEELRNDWDKKWGSFSSSAITSKMKEDQRYIDTSEQETYWAGCVQAMDQKKRALEALVKLGSMEYFSMPRESRELNRQFDKAITHKEVSEKVSKALNKPRRTA